MSETSASNVVPMKALRANDRFVGTALCVIDLQILAAGAVTCVGRGIALVVCLVTQNDETSIATTDDDKGLSIHRLQFSA